MGGWNSIDWTYLEGLFGKYGKLITAVIAVLTAVIPLLAAIFSYLHSRVLKKERDQARADLNRERLQVKKEQAAVDKEKGKVQRRKEALETKNAALQKAAARLIDQEAALKERERKLNHVRTAFKGKEHELWCMHAARKPESYDSRMVRQRSKPIIMVANLKGGVGKTTLCANLAAHFSAVGKRVLLLDVDYQGSLSNMLLSADGVEVVSAEVNKLLTPGADLLAFKSAARPFKKILNGSSIVPGKYEFASLENQV